MLNPIKESLTKENYEWYKIQKLSNIEYEIYNQIKEYCYTRNPNIPILIKIGKIGKDNGITYKQARRILKKLTDLNLIEKFTTTYAKNKNWNRSCYYRLIHK